VYPARVTTGHSDAWNTRHRDEPPLRRADRNFGELLQELRVVLTGVQILFGFLLTLSFSDHFRELDDLARGLYLVTLGCVAVTSLLLVAPVAAHRILFRRNRKRELVRAGHRLALAGLGALALTLASGVSLVLELAVGRTAAAVGGGALLAATLVLWWALPTRLGRESAAAEPLPERRLSSVGVRTAPAAGTPRSRTASPGRT